jgi:hypothetical protein
VILRYRSLGKPSNSRGRGSADFRPRFGLDAGSRPASL